MKTHRWILSLIAVALLVLVWGPSAQAQTVTSSLSIDFSDKITEPDGEVLTVTGPVVVNCTKVTDEVGLNPQALLTFDFSRVTATSGSGPNKKTYTTGGYATIKNRPFQETDTLVFTCPYFTDQAGILSAEAWAVSVTLNFNLNTGKLKGGTADAFSNPYLGQ